MLGSGMFDSIQFNSIRSLSCMTLVMLASLFVQSLVFAVGFAHVALLPLLAKEVLSENIVILLSLLLSPTVHECFCVVLIALGLDDILEFQFLFYTLNHPLNFLKMYPPDSPKNLRLRVLCGVVTVAMYFPCLFLAHFALRWLCCQISWGAVHGAFECHVAMLAADHKEPDAPARTPLVTPQPYDSTEHAKREKVYVDVKLTREELAVLRHTFPDREPVPAPRATAHNHACLRVERAYAYRVVDDYITGLGTNGIIVDIGGNPMMHQYHMRANHNRVHSVAPTLYSGDVIRRIRADQHPRACDHAWPTSRPGTDGRLVPGCTCDEKEPFDVAISIDTIYYLTARDVLRTVFRVRSGIMIAVLHRFDGGLSGGQADNLRESLGCYYGQSYYQIHPHREDDGTVVPYVTMTVDGGAVSYTHPLPMWLNLYARQGLVNPRHFSHGDLAMSWEVIATIGTMSIVIFRKDRPRVESPIRQPDAPQEVVLQPAHSSALSLRSPGSEPGTGILRHVSVYGDDSYVWSFGPILITANSIGRCLMIPKAVFGEIRHCLAGIHRGRVTTQDERGISHVRAATTYPAAVQSIKHLLESRYNMPKEMIADVVEYVLPSMYADTEGPTRALEAAFTPALSRWWGGLDRFDRLNDLLNFRPRMDYAAVGWKLLICIVLYACVCYSSYLTLTFNYMTAWSTVVVREEMYTSFGRLCSRQLLRHEHPIWRTTEQWNDNCQTFFNLFFSTEQTIPGRVMRSFFSTARETAYATPSFIWDQVTWAAGLLAREASTPWAWPAHVYQSVQHYFAPAPGWSWSSIVLLFVAITVAAHFVLRNLDRLWRFVLFGRPHAASAPWTAVSVALLFMVFNPAFAVVAVAIWLLFAPSVPIRLVAEYPHARYLPPGYTATGPLVTKAVTMDHTPDAPLRHGAKLRTLSDIGMDFKERPVNLQSVSVNGTAYVTAASSEINTVKALRNRTLQALPEQGVDADGIPQSWDDNTFDDFEAFVERWFEWIFVPDGAKFQPQSERNYKARFTPAIQDRMDAELDAYLTGRMTYRRLCRRGAFPKVELSEILFPEDDVELSSSVDPRAILTTTEAMKLLIGPHVQGMAGFIKGMWTPDHFLVYTAGLNPIELGTCFHAFRNLRGAAAISVVESDHKRFDSTQHARYLRLECDVYRRLGALKRENLCRDGRAFTYHLENLIRIYGRTSGGSKFGGVDGVGSGSPNTSLGNTLRLLLSALYAFCKATGATPDRLGAPGELGVDGRPLFAVQLLGNGDDLAILYDALYQIGNQRVGFDEAVYMETLSKLGLRPVLQPGRDLDTVTFCSARPYLCEQLISAGLQAPPAAAVAHLRRRPARERLSAVPEAVADRTAAVALNLDQKVPEILIEPRDPIDAPADAAHDAAAIDGGGVHAVALVDVWERATVMGPKIGKALPKYLTINDPAKADILRDPTSEKNQKIIKSHYRAVATGWKHLGPHVPLVNDMTDRVLELTEDVDADMLRTANRRSLEYRFNQPMRPVRQTGETLAQVSRIYGLPLDFQTQWQRCLDQMESLSGGDLNLPLLDRMLRVDNACLACEAATDVSYYNCVMIVVEELVKQLFGWWCIGIPELWKYGAFNMCLHFALSYLDIELRILVHALWNFVLVPALRRDRPGAAWVHVAGLHDRLAAAGIFSNKNRTYSMPKHVFKNGRRVETKELKPAFSKGARVPETDNRAAVLAAVRREVDRRLQQSAPRAPPSTPRDVLAETKAHVVPDFGKALMFGASHIGGRSKTYSDVVRSVVDAVKPDHKSEVAVVPAPVATAVKATPLMPAATATAAGIGVSLAKTLHNNGPQIIGRRVGKHPITGEDRNIVRIRNREPVREILGTAAYTAFSEPLNPANVNLFPYLSLIAPAFEMYSFSKCVIEFATEEGTAKKGRIGVNFDYECIDPTPSNRIAFEQQRGTTVSADWKNFSCRMRPGVSHHVNWYFVSSSSSSSTSPHVDPRVTNQALVQWFTADCEDLSTNGEMWVSYECELMENVSGGALQVTGAPFLAFAGTGAGAAGSTLITYFASPNSTVPGSNPAYTIVPHPTVATSTTVFAYKIVLPSTPIGAATGQRLTLPGSFIINLFTQCGSAVLTPVITYGTATTLHIQPSITASGWNSSSFNLPVNSAGNDSRILRVDVAGGVSFAITSNSINDPGFLYSVTAGVANAYNVAFLGVYPCSSAAGPLTSHRLCNDGVKVREFDVSTAMCFDGAVRVRVNHAISDAPADPMRPDDGFDALSTDAAERAPLTTPPPNSVPNNLAAQLIRPRRAAEDNWSVIGDDVYFRQGGRTDEKVDRAPKKKTEENK
jgi:hypothetical protein